MAQQPDETDRLREGVPPPSADIVAPVDPEDSLSPQEPTEAQGLDTNSDPSLKVFDLNFRIGSTKPLPAGVLSNEVIERLRSGGELSADEIATLQAAASADPGFVATLVDGLLAAGFTEQAARATVTVPADGAGDPDVAVIPGSVRKFEWTWTNGASAQGTEPEPATYYEALTGRPDPMRSFFVTSRRLLNIVTWIIALGLPIGLIVLGIVVGESSETIFFMGFAGLLVGMLFKYSFPRTPFG